MSPYVTVLATLALLLISANALAEENCTVGTLKGQYVFTGRGFIEALEPGVQRMHYGGFIFDGSGKFTGKQSSSRGGKIGREKLDCLIQLIGRHCRGESCRHVGVQWRNS